MLLSPPYPTVQSHVQALQHFDIDHLEERFPADLRYPRNVDQKGYATFDCRSAADECGLHFGSQQSHTIRHRCDDMQRLRPIRLAET